MAEEGQAPLPYSVPFAAADPETARSLFREGATLLFLNVPVGTLVGLDGQVFTVGPNFMGVKMIAPGVHLVTTQAVQQPSRHDDGDQRRQGTAAAPPSAAPALATFLDLPPRSVLVRAWDARAEALAPLLDADEEARFAAGARRGDFDRGLAPYDLGGGGGGGGGAGGAAAAATPTPTTGGWARWRSLAGLITPELAQRLMPPSVRLSDGRECAAPLSVTAEAAAAEGGGAAPSSSAAERRLDAQLAEGRMRRQEQQSESGNAMVVVTPEPSTTATTTTTTGTSGSALARLALAPAPEPTRARYTPIERLSKPVGLTPEQLTAANLDKSTAAEALLRAVVAREGEAKGPGPPPSLPLAALLTRGGPLLLGELQFAFAAFAAGGQSLEGFHQWRSMACLLLGCERLPFGEEAAEEASAAAAASFFAAFLRILAAQLRYAFGVGGGGDQKQQPPAPSPLLVDDDLLRQSFLRQGVRRFLSALRAAEKRPQQSSSSQLEQVRAAAELVVSALKEGLGGWEEEQVGGGGGDGGDHDDEGDEDDEDDGPTVVDLDEGYAL